MNIHLKQLPIGTASRISLFAAGQVCSAYLPNLETGSG